MVITIIKGTIKITNNTVILIKIYVSLDDSSYVQNYYNPNQNYQNTGSTETSSGSTQIVGENMQNMSNMSNIQSITSVQSSTIPGQIPSQNQLQNQIEDNNLKNSNN